MSGVNSIDLFVSTLNLRQASGYFFREQNNHSCEARIKLILVHIFSIAVNS